MAGRWLAAITGLAVRTDPALRERAFRHFEGENFAEIEARWPEEVVRGLRQGKAIARVAHGGVLDCLYRVTAGIALEAPRTWQLRNACVNRLLYTGEGFVLAGWRRHALASVAGCQAGSWPACGGRFADATGRSSNIAQAILDEVGSNLQCSREGARGQAAEGIGSCAVSAKMNLKQWVRWVAALSMALPLAAAAEGVGIYGGFIGIGTDSAAPYQWHNAGLTRHSWIVDGNGDQVDFQDRVLGAFALGDSAFLSAGQLITHRGSDEQIEGAALHYCVRPIGNACSFAELDLPQAGEVSATSGFTDAAGYVWQFLNDPSNDAALGDRLWFGAPAVNFLNGLGAGDYALEVYFSATSSLGNTLWSFNPATGGATFVAVFSVTGTPSGVPEPPSLALAGLSLAMLAAVRRTWR